LPSEHLRRYLRPLRIAPSTAGRFASTVLELDL
jgi:hypothetical protein